MVYCANNRVYYGGIRKGMHKSLFIKVYWYSINNEYPKDIKIVT
jgi:hypothetical protein